MLSTTPTPNGLTKERLILNKQYTDVVLFIPIFKSHHPGQMLLPSLINMEGCVAGWIN